MEQAPQPPLPPKKRKGRPLKVYTCCVCGDVLDRAYARADIRAGYNPKCINCIRAGK